MEYWVTIKGEKKGPLREWEIRERIDREEVTSDALMWHAGLDQWQTITEFSAFKTSFDKPEEKGPEIILEDGIEPTDDLRERIDELQKGLEKSIQDVSGDSGVAPKVEVVTVETVKFHFARRVIAKFLDLFLYVIIFSILANLAGMPFGFDPKLEWLRLVLLIPFFFFEGFLLHATGRTLGKWALGLKIESFLGERLTIQQGLLRSASSWFLGMALGLFPVIFLSMLINYYTTKQRGMAMWDLMAKTKVTGSKQSPVVSSLRTFGSVFLIFALFSTFISNHKPTYKALVEFHEKNVETIVKERPELEKFLRLPEPPAQ